MYPHAHVHTHTHKDFITKDICDVHYFHSLHISWPFLLWLCFPKERKAVPGGGMPVIPALENEEFNVGLEYIERLKPV